MRAHGKLVKHEEARDNGDLVFIDDFEALRILLARYPTVFISHQCVAPLSRHQDAALHSS